MSVAPPAALPAPGYRRCPTDEGPELASALHAQSVEPRLGLFRLARRARGDRTARRNEVAVQREGFDTEPSAHRVDRLARLDQFGDDGRELRLRLAVLAVSEIFPNCALRSAFDMTAPLSVWVGLSALLASCVIGVRSSVFDGTP